MSDVASNTTIEEIKTLLGEATDGPWHWNAPGSADGTDEAVRSYWCLSPGILIAGERDGTPDGDEIDRANARLIALAPTLAKMVLEQAKQIAALEAEAEGAHMVIAEHRSRIARITEELDALREAAMDAIDAWLWWLEDETDRCRSVPNDALDVLRVELKKQAPHSADATGREVERVARAICIAAGDLPDTIPTQSLEQSQDPLWKTDYEDMAKAAIEAMSAPVEVVLEAAHSPQGEDTHQPKASQNTKGPRQ